MSEALHKDAKVVSVVTTALNNLLQSSQSICYATVVTEDGFEVATVKHFGFAFEYDTQVASMVSSIEALSTAATSTLTIGNTDSIILSSVQGEFIIRRIDGQPLLLATVFDKSDNLGRVLVSSANTQLEISNGLNL